ncbi:hypothetical protein LCGC14_0713550 [marine sediment metagenome]|uniref:Uncharacterized protein n=1 Tax=marine sediment metagenome TaxID=412755 RepID=A0A0F9QIV6_9ZZZZ
MIPACPDHPKAKVMVARKPATTEGVYVCVVCGKHLGSAGLVSPPKPEQFDIER